jgi:hypothetical protein
VLADLSPGRLVKILDMNFQKVPPIANRALDGHLRAVLYPTFGIMFHKIQLTVDCGRLTVKAANHPRPGIPVLLSLDSFRVDSSV